MSYYDIVQKRRAHHDLRYARLLRGRSLGTHTKEQWGLLIQQCGYVCVKCKNPYPLVKDHIVPLYAGGSDAIGNLQPLCAWCNTGKGPEMVDYRPAGAVARSLVAIRGVM